MGFFWTVSSFPLSYTGFYFINPSGNKICIKLYGTTCRKPGVRHSKCLWTVIKAEAIFQYRCFHIFLALTNQDQSFNYSLDLGTLFTCVNLLRHSYLNQERSWSMQKANNKEQDVQIRASVRQWTLIEGCECNNSALFQEKLWVFLTLRSSRYMHLPGWGRLSIS